MSAYFPLGGSNAVLGPAPAAGSVDPTNALNIAGNAAFTGNISAGNMGMFRNRVINGDMRVDQRNAGNAGNSGFGPDRFKVVGSNCATSVLPRRIELGANDVAATGGAFQYATSLSAIAGPTAGLTAYLGFNSNVTDVMGGLVNPTVTGTVRYVPGVVPSAGTASALYLANEGNLLATPTRATNTLSFTTNVSGAFSVSLWFQLTKLPLSGAIQIFSFGTTATTYYEITITYVNSTYGNLNAWSGNNTTNAPVSMNVWYHVAAVWIPSSTVQLYLNGMPVGGTAVVTSTTYSNITFCIGEEIRTNNNRPFAGYIDDFRIYNRALGSGEIALLAGLTTGISSAPSSGLAAYYPFDGSTAETSGNSGPALTTTGSVSYVTGAIGGQSVYLANEARVVSSPTQKGLNQLSSGAILNISSSITISAWVQFTKLPQSGGYSSVISLGISATEYIVLLVTYSTATIGLLSASSNSTSTTTFPVATGIWYHITGVWVPSSTVTLYVNGSHIGTTNSTSGTFTNGILVIGDSFITAYNRPFAGYIDDFRLYNRALTSAEIAYLAGNAPYPSIQTFNQAAHFPFDGALTDASGNGVTLTPTGSVQYVTGVTGTQAVYLANEANMLATNTRASNRLTANYTHTGPISASAWVYVTKIPVSGAATIFNVGTAAVPSMRAYINMQSELGGYIGVAGMATAPIKINTWFHVTTILIPNSMGYLYLNGSLIASAANTQAALGSSTILLGEAVETAVIYPFAGYIDDFRFYNTALTQSQIAALYYGSAHIANQATPYLGYVPSAAVLYQQSIEGNNVADLFYGTANAAPVAVSLWLKNATASAQSFTLALNNGGAGGASRSALYPIASVAPNTWRRVAVKIPGDLIGTWARDNGLGLNVALVLGTNSNVLTATASAWQTGAYFTTETSQNYAASATGFLALQDNAVYVTGVQLEKGTLVTPFEFRPYGIELGLCQRYLETGATAIIGSGSVGNNLVGSFINFNVFKRVSPIITQLTQIENYNIGTVIPLQFSQVYQNGYRLYCGIASAGIAYWTGTYSASAEL